MIELSKNKVKYIQSLRLKKNRLKLNSFLVEGEKIVLELLQDRNLSVELVCATDSWIETYAHLAQVLKEKLILVTERQLKQISNLTTPNQVLAVVTMPTLEQDKELVLNNISLYLDGIQDPGNMGTILRTADWFGIPHVFCSMTCADLYNPKVIQASMGAFLRVKYIKIAFEDLQKSYPDLATFGAVLEGENIFEMDLPQQGIIVIGNESKGISKPILNQLAHPIRIPSASAAGAESLNAGVATGIICALFRNSGGLKS